MKLLTDVGPVDIEAPMSLWMSPPGGSSTSGMWTTTGVGRHYRVSTPVIDHHCWLPCGAEWPHAAPSGPTRTMNCRWWSRHRRV